MNKATARNIVFLVALLAAGSVLLAPGALAQCAMCKASAANLDGVSARSLNLATLILLCPPVAIFCAIFVVAYKRRNSHDEGDES